MLSVRVRIWTVNWSKSCNNWGKAVGKEKYIYTKKLPQHSFRAFSITLEQKHC